MPKYTTHKNTSKGKRQTIERKIRRAIKHQAATVQSLADVAKDVNARYLPDTDG